MSLRAPDPAHMLPIVRHGEIALAREALLLHVAPVVVGAPDDAAGEARLEGDGAGAIVAAERNALAADPLRDRRRRASPASRRFCSPRFRRCRRRADPEGAAPRRFPAGRRRATTRRACASHARQADAVFHLLRRIEPVELDEDRRAALDAFGAGVERGQMRFRRRGFRRARSSRAQAARRGRRRSACACRGRGGPARCAPAGARRSGSRSRRARICRRPKSAGRALRPLRRAHRACRPSSTRSRGRRRFRRRRAAWRPPAAARTSPRSRRSWRPSRSRDRPRGSRRSWSGNT